MIVVSSGNTHIILHNIIDLQSTYDAVPCHLDFYLRWLSSPIQLNPVTFHLDMYKGVQILIVSEQTSAEVSDADHIF